MIFIDQPKIIRSKNMENYKYTENEIEERAQRLVSEMTIEEKCEQLKYILLKLKDWELISLTGGTNVFTELPEAVRLQYFLRL